MRFNASEKEEIIKLVVRSEIGVTRTLKEIGLNKSTFYNWYKVYCDQGIDGLEPSERCSKRQWNKYTSGTEKLRCRTRPGAY